MPELVPRLWRDLVPWDAVVSQAGQTPWTILPGNRPGVLTAVNWATQERRQFAPDPNGHVLTLAPTMPEAVAELLRQFPASIILEGQMPGQPLTIGPSVLHDIPALATHLLRHHGTPGPHVRHAQQFEEVARYHEQVHRQALVYPPSVPHWHAS